VNFADSESKSVSHANRRAWRPVLLQSLCNCRVYCCPRPERHEPVRFARDRRWKLYGDGRFHDVQQDPLEDNALPEPAEGTEAAAGKKKLAEALRQMPSEGRMLLRFSDKRR
ncbi:MAG: hypothetical protein ACQESR_14145, partial [Planctomycetota bacterium]